MRTSLPTFLRLTVLSGIGALLVLLSGCATATQPAAMAATSLAPQKHHSASVDVVVTGGSETSAAGASQISNQDFASAITESIRQSQLFTAVVAEGSSHRLEAYIVRVEQPMFGGTFTVKLEVNWKLLNRQDNKVVWQHAISSSGTATMGEAFAGVKRLRLATEKAAKNNIEDALRQLGELTL